MLIKVLLLSINIFIHSSLQISTPSSPTYEAAVVELNYGLRNDMDIVTYTEESLKEYLEIIDQINPKPDILVFSESTLNDMETAEEIPQIKDKVCPCDDAKFEVASSLVKKLSCAAKRNNLYLVINLTTKVKCPDPESDLADQKSCKDTKNGHFLYNTNVVFDRKGTVIARYRKYNLYGEDVDRPMNPEMITFTTDFGVTFGTIICFDLMFRRPAVELVRSQNVTDIIFTTMWYSDAPFWTAIQTHMNWAYSLDVNVLSAGANFPYYGSTGSGIYGGKKGAYVMEMVPANMTMVYRATVYKKIPENEGVKIKHDIRRHSPAEMKSLYISRDQIDDYDMEFLNDSDGSHYKEKNVCKDGFCCNIKVNYTVKASASKRHYQYALAFDHGIRTFIGYPGGHVGYVACAILACRTHQISSCGVRDESLEIIHVWNNVEISGKLPTENGQYLYMPTSLDTSILPLQPEQFSYNVKHNGDNDEIEIRLNGNIENLLVFGIYGRDFDLDSGAVGIKLSILLILLLISKIFILI